MKDSCSYFASNTRRVGKSTKVPEHLGISFWWPLRPPPKQRTRNKTTLKTPLGSITGKKFLLSLVLSLHTYVQIKQRQLSLYQIHPSFKTNQSFSLQTQRSIIQRILNYRFIIFSLSWFLLHSSQETLANILLEIHEFKWSIRHLTPWRCSPDILICSHTPHIQSWIPSSKQIALHRNTHTCWKSSTGEISHLSCLLTQWGMIQTAIIQRQILFHIIYTNLMNIQHCGSEGREAEIHYLSTLQT